MTRRASPERVTAAIKAASPWLVGAACADAAVVKSADIRASVSARTLERYSSAGFQSTWCVARPKALVFRSSRQTSFRTLVSSSSVRSSSVALRRAMSAPAQASMRSGGKTLSNPEPPRPVMPIPPEVAQAERAPANRNAPRRMMEARIVEPTDRTKPRAAFAR